MLTRASCRPPYTPLLYSKIGVYRSMHYFRIFALKHRLWVLLRTSKAVLTCAHNLFFEQKIKRNIKLFHMKIINFYKFEKLHYFEWACYPVSFTDVRLI